MPFDHPRQRAGTRTLRGTASAATVLGVGLALAGCGEPVAPDPCVEAVPIALGEEVSGELVAAEDCLTAQGWYADRWRFAIGEETEVLIDLVSTRFDAFLELHDEAGSVITTNDDAPGTLNSRIIETLAPGAYTIIARSLDAGRTGIYSLSLGIAPDCSPLGTMTAGTPVSGTLVDGDCLAFGGVADHWTFTVPSATEYRLHMTNSGFLAAIAVKNSNDQILEFAIGPAEDAGVRTERRLGADTYTISAVAAVGSPGHTYDLEIDLAPPCEPGTELVLEETTSGTLDADDCYYASNLPADSFALALAATTPLSFHLKSEDFQPVVLVQDPAGSDLAIGFDPIRTGDADVGVTLEAGTYSVYAMSAYPRGSGSFTLTVTEVACNVQPITFGETVTGLLSALDCAGVGGQHQETWELTLANDTTARIDLASEDFDTYLVLLDSVGGLVESDDDDGPGLDARIERRLEAGRYQIVVTTFGQGQQGTYELTVDVPPPAGGAEAHGAMPELRPKGPAAGPEGWRALRKSLLEKGRPTWPGTPEIARR